MRAIETIVDVAPDGTATTRLPVDVVPGSHRAVLVLDETKLGRLPKDQTLFAAPTGIIEIVGDIISPVEVDWEAMR